MHFSFRRLSMLVYRESYRFLKVWGQTILSPLTMAVLYFVVFGGAIGSEIREIQGVSYLQFIIPGLILLQASQNAFQNPASSLNIARYSGILGDFLLPPLTAFEKMLGFALGGTVRGTVVGLVILVVCLLFVNPTPDFHWGLFLSALFLTNICFSFAGTLTGIWARSFDQVNVVASFLLLPMAFLGGVFYSIDMLAPPLQKLILLNPFFYFVDFAKVAFGTNHLPLLISSGVCLGLTIFMGFLVWLAFRMGWKLKI